MSSHKIIRRAPGIVALLVAGFSFAVSGCNGSSSSPPPPPGANGSMFITDFTNNSVSVYSQGANCNCAPERLIQGGNTGMLQPAGIAVLNGTIYVANEGANSLTEYPASSAGNINFSFRITGLSSPVGVAVDAANNVYVANSASAGGTPSIMVFHQGMTTPFLTISGAATGLSTPSFLTLDKSGNIWVANQTGNSVEEFDGVATNPGGNVAPIAVISGSNTQLSSPQGLAFFGGSLLVGTNNPPGFFDEVLFFSPPLNGNIAPTNAICGPATAVNNPTGVAVNSLGTVFVVNSATAIAGYITIFASNNIGNLGCNGPVANASVGGGNTGLVNPAGIALR